MGRHRTDEEKVELREKALALRAQGVKRADILTRLRIGDDLLNAFVSGAPLPDALARPRAKDEVRAIAVGLRRQGWSYNQIVRELGISKGSCSLWLRDVEVRDARDEPASDPVITDDPVPRRSGSSEGAASEREDLHEVAREMRREGMLLKEIAEALSVSVQSAWRWTKSIPVPERARHGRSADECRVMQRERVDRVLAERQAEREAVAAEARTMWGALTGRDLILALVVSYWCEGSKSKPWARCEQIKWMNSDPRLVLLFMEGLRWLGVRDDQMVFRLHIHETADEVACRQWWAEVLGVPADSFRSSTIKRHNPKTNRKNRLEGYRGCLCISVLQSRLLYQLVEGLFDALGGAPREQDPATDGGSLA